MTALPVSEQPASGPLARITAFMDAFSIEATRPSEADIAALGALKRGTRVYLSSVPNRPVQESVVAAVRLRAVGLEPVPHIAVRNFENVEALDSFLAQLHGEAAVERVLVIAGDRTESGPFRYALDVVESGALRRRGITAIGIAGYPDGHPRIGADDLRGAMKQKIAAAEAAGLAVEIVTQFCFEARTILDFVAGLRALGIDHPVRVGIAGPTSLTSLMRYASRCGVRSSAQAMTRRTSLVRQMFSMATPDDLIRGLAETAPFGVVPHFFSFGGIAATGRWARAVADGHIALDGADGFKVEPPAAG